MKDDSYHHDYDSIDTATSGRGGSGALVLGAAFVVQGGAGAAAVALANGLPVHGAALMAASALAAAALALAAHEETTPGRGYA